MASWYLEDVPELTLDDLFNDSFLKPEVFPINNGKEVPMINVKSEPCFDWNPSQASISFPSTFNEIDLKMNPVEVPVTNCAVHPSIKSDLSIPEQGIAFLVFQQDPIHCTSRFSIYLHVHKQWREQLTLQDQIKALIYKNLRTYCLKDGKYVPQDSCPKPCSTWVKNNKKKPSTNGIIQIKQVKDPVEEYCGTQQYEKIEIVCKLLCSTPTHYQSQLFIAMENFDSSDLIISPPFEFLARKDPHKNKRKSDSLSTSPPSSPLSYQPNKKRKVTIPLSAKKIFKQVTNAQGFSNEYTCVERCYTSSLGPAQLWEVATEFHSYLTKNTLGLLAYEAEMVNDKVVTRSYYNTPENSMSSVELSIMYVQNSPVCPNKFHENLKKSGKLCLVAIRS